MRWRDAWVVAIGATTTTVGIALAQEPVGAPQPAPIPVRSTGLKAVACGDQVIERIEIDADFPIVAEDMARVPRLAALQRRFHTLTRREVVRAFLLLAEGEPCDEARRAESERLLRAQGFIAQARIRTYDSGDRQVVLVVSVVDEFSPQLDLAVATSSPYVRRFAAGSSNVDGRGITLNGQWRTGLAYRDEAYGRFESYTFEGKPLQVTLAGAMRTLGGDWSLDVGRGFLTDYQRIAWRVGLGQSDGYVPFARRDTEPSWVGFRRVFAEVGGMMRLGRPGNLWSFGASLSREATEVSSAPILLRSTGPLPDTTSVLVGQFQRRDARRLNLLIGLRRVRFFNVSGFDVVEGTQDLRTGAQIGLLIGRGLRELGADDRDVLLTSELFIGQGGQNRYLVVNAKWQARYRDVRSGWDAVMWDASAALYWRLRENRTLIATTTWAGGYRSATPFQLTLGEPTGGLRGFADSRQAGGERVVVNLEDRWYVGRISSLAAVGIAPFIGVGIMGARDAPFGATSPPAVSIGLSLLAAVPPRSRRLFRADASLRLTPDGALPVFTFGLSSRDDSRAGFREPTDVVRSRARASTPSAYTWP